MSTTSPATTIQSAKPKQKKSKEKFKEKDRREKQPLPTERLKIVVRRLPSNLPEEIFWQSVSNWVTDETAVWKTYFPGKPRKRVNKENIPSRAYIAFRNAEQSVVFGREYDGHKFVDKAGNESYAVVEFAPYQKIPSEKKKPDARNATIDKDEDYISFLESLNPPSNPEPISLEALIASARPPSPPKTTPLLEALKAERQAQKDKEAIIRNHPHYKDTMNTSVAILRGEGKRKTASAGAKAEAAIASGKKLKKGPPPSVKQVQIQAKPVTSSNGVDKVNAIAQPAKPQIPSAKGARGSKQHAKNPAIMAATPAASTTSAVATPAPDPVPPVANTSTNATAIQETPHANAAKRDRPVLGLPSRQFEAALNGVGMASTRERRRREKGHDSVPAAAPGSTVLGSSHNVTTGEKPPPPLSPKRQRQRKDGHTGAPGGGDAAVTGSGIMAIPSGATPDPGAFSHPTGGRGGRRGRGGGMFGVRGRGYPPRVG